MPRRRRPASAGGAGGAGASEDMEDAAMDNGGASEQVFQPSYFRVKKAGTLVRRLQEAHRAFMTVEQDARPGDITGVARLLASDDFVKHANKDVRLLSACVLVNLLRIFAPDAPFDSTTLLTVFDLIVAQIRGLERVEGAAYDRCFYILESLATVQTSNALVAIAQDAELDDDEAALALQESASETLVELFDTLLSRVTAQHPAKIGEYIVDIITSCIEDMLSVSEQLLDCLLRRLLPNLDEPNQEVAASLVTAVIRRCIDRLQPVISQFVVHALADPSSDRGVTSRSSPEVLQLLIIQLNHIDASLLLHILPVICEQLQVQDVDVRLSAVELLSQLFLTPGVDMAGMYATNYVEFLGRFTDSDSSVREAMVRFAGEVLLKKPEMTHVAEALCKRLADPVKDVRLHALKAFEVAASSDAVDKVAAMPVALFTAVADRLLDKQADVRKVAMTALAKAYACTVCSRWEEEDAEELSADLVARVLWIPGKIFRCFAFKEGDLKLRVVQLLDYILLRRNLSLRARAMGLLQMYVNLNEMEAAAFAKIMAFRHTARVALRRFLALQDTARADRGESAQGAAMAAAAKLCAFLPSGKAHASTLRDLSKVKDQLVFKSLAKLVDASTPQSELFEAREDVIRRLAPSHEAVAAAVKPLLRHATLHTTTVDSMPFVLQFIADYDDGESAEAAGTLLTTFAAHFPRVFDRVHKALGELAGSRVQATKTAALCALAHVAPRYQAVPRSAKLANSMKRHLIATCLSATPRQAKHAVLAMCGMYKSAAPVEELIGRLVADDVLTAGNEHLEAVLRSLAAVASAAPAAFEPSSLDAAQFALQTVLCGPLPQDYRRQRRTVSDTARCRAAAIKTVVNIARCLVRVEGQEADAELAATMCLTNLARVLENDGNPPTGSIDLSATDRAVLRRHALGGLLRIVRVRAFDAQVTPAVWRCITNAMADDDREVRSYALRKLHKGLVARAGALSVQYLACFVVFAQDADQTLRKQARSLLAKAVHFKHQVYKAHVERAGPDGAGEVAVHRHMPEYALPFAIHQLAHQRVTSPDDLVTPATTQKLSFIIDGLMSTSATNDNMGFIRHLLQRLHDCVDVEAPHVNHIQVLVELAQRVLQKRVRRDTNLANYRGPVYLPTLYFRQSARAQRLDAVLPADFSLQRSPAKKRLSSSSTPKKKSPASRNAKSRRQKANPQRSPGSTLGDSGEAGSAALARATRRSSRSSARNAQAGMYAEDSDGDVGAAPPSPLSPTNSPFRNASSPVPHANTANESADSRDSGRDSPDDLDGEDDDEDMPLSEPTPPRATRSRRGKAAAKPAKQAAAKRAAAKQARPAARATRRSRRAR